MLKEFAQYLVSLKENRTYEIEGETYSDNPLTRIPPHVDRPKLVGVNSLHSIVQLVRRELDRFGVLPVFVHVRDAHSVQVFTTLDAIMERDNLYEAICDVPGFRDGFRDYESAVIELRSRFVSGEDVEYLLDLISRINVENGVTTSDNGISQSVEARTGISLKEMVVVRPRVTLRPFRTFLEVEQPKSEFLLRLNDAGQVGLFEADGGMWKLAAKDNISKYFEAELAELIDAGHVVVMA